VHHSVPVSGVVADASTCRSDASAAAGDSSLGRDVLTRPRSHRPTTSTEYHHPVRLVLLSGIPGTGKTSFGLWLSKEHRFRHEDLEKHPNHLAWLERKQPRSFIDEIRSGRPDLILDWGFPPNDGCFAKVRRLVAAGMNPWWFDGDRTAALASFRARGTVSVETWDVQMAQVERRWDDIQEIFGANRIDVIGSDAVYLPPEEIYARMFGNP
jgi:DNA polymerase III delta prime subunit